LVETDGIAKIIMDIKKLYKLGKILKEFKDRGFCLDIIAEVYINNKDGSVSYYRPVFHFDPMNPSDIEMNFDFLSSYKKVRIEETRIYNTLDIIRAPNTSLAKQRVAVIRDTPSIKELNHKLNDILTNMMIKNL
jgi:hypothetical protein